MLLTHEMVCSCFFCRIAASSNQVLARDLTQEEVVLVENSVSDYLDWFQIIENAILEHIKE